MDRCELPDSRLLEKRGLLWIAGAFVFCPCHLPLTMSALALLLGGTAAGVMLREHPYIAAAVVTSLWIAGTWRGFALVKRATAFASRPAPSAGSASASRPDRP